MLFMVLILQLKLYLHANIVKLNEELKVVIDVVVHTQTQPQDQSRQIRMYLSIYIISGWAKTMSYTKPA
jgi:hypothetical protein